MLPREASPGSSGHARSAGGRFDRGTGRAVSTGTVWLGARETIWDSVRVSTSSGAFWRVFEFANQETIHQV